MSALVGFRVRVWDDRYYYGVVTGETEWSVTVCFDSGYVENSIPRSRVEYVSTVTEVG